MKNPHCYELEQFQKTLIPGICVPQLEELYLPVEMFTVDLMQSIVRMSHHWTIQLGMWSQRMWIQHDLLMYSYKSFVSKW